MIDYEKANVKFAKQLRKNATPWENKLWYEYLRGLKKQGFKFVRQKPIGPYIADFYCHQLRLIIELDGSGHYTLEQQAYDRERTIYFNNLGYKEIRFLNTDINTKFKEVCTLIQDNVTNS